MDDWDTICREIIDNYNPNHATPRQYLNQVLQTRNNQQEQVLQELQLRLEITTAKDGKLKSAVNKLQKCRSSKDKAINHLQTLFPPDAGGNPINFIPEALRPPTLSFALTAELLGLTKEVIANGLDIKLIWETADCGGLVIPLMNERRKRSAREVVTAEVLRVARSNLKHRIAAQEHEAVAEASLTDIDDNNSDLFSTQSSTIEVGRCAPQDSSLGIGSMIDDFEVDGELNDTLNLEDKSLGLVDDMDEVITNTEDDEIDTSLPFGPKRQLSSSMVDSTKRRRTATTSSDCLQAGERLNDACLNKLITLAITGRHQAFAAIDSLTLQAHATSSSTLGSRTPGVLLTECAKFESIILPFYHMTQTHWTLFVYHRSERLLVHYDSITNSVAQESLWQIYNFLTWLYQVQALDYEIETRRVSSPPVSQIIWLTRGQAAYQSNTFDCGVYVVETARCLAAGIDPAKRFCQITASELRGEYARAITFDHMDAVSTHTDLVHSSATIESPFPNLIVLLKDQHRKYTSLTHCHTYLTKLLAAFQILVERRQSLELKFERSRSKLGDKGVALN